MATLHLRAPPRAEIITELGPQGIGRDSIENALGALIQREKSVRKTG
jgi:hypothetical protein